MHANAPMRTNMLRRPRYASRGQALIMVVMLMLLLAGLGGLFIAMINQSLVQTARAVDRQELESIAQAGFSQVKQQLLYSPDGADWRPYLGPDQANRGWIHYADGFYKITVGYGPSTPINANTPFLSNPLDRYLKVDIEASFGLQNQPQFADPSDPAFADYQLGYANPKRFLNRKMTAFMPIALTDYMLWITNLHGGSDPAVLGTDLTLDQSYDTGSATNTIPAPALVTGTDPTAYDDSTAVNVGINYAGTGMASTVSSSALSVSYLPTFDGPIRSEVDLQVGQGRFDLTNTNLAGTDAAQYAQHFSVQRNDLLEVVGKVNDFEGCAANCRRLLFNGHGTPLSSVLPQDVDPVNATSSGVSLPPILVPYLQTEQTNPQMQPLHAPHLDTPHSPLGLNRYRALTRDSDSSATVSGMTNGAIGWGEGVYLNNPEQVQDGGNLDQLRGEWLRGSGSNWSTQGIYRPEKYNPTSSASSALVLILHDWSDANGGSTALTNFSNPPNIELREYADQNFSTPSRYLFDQNGAALNSTSTGQNIVGTCQYAYGTGADAVGTYYFAQHPYPRNGVIFAEGNLIVKGKLPASIAYLAPTTPGAPLSPYSDWSNTQHWGGWNPSDGSTNYYVNDYNRRYDLTIVSGATIYLNGNVLTPASYNATYLDGGNPTAITRGVERDSKLALLATDNVCLNPTQLFADIRADLPVAPADQNGEAYYRASSTQTSAITFNYTTAGNINPRTRLVLRHAADANSGASATAIQLTVNNASAAYNWASALNAVNPALYTATHMSPLNPQYLFFYDPTILCTSTATNSSMSAEIYGGPLYNYTSLYNAGTAFNIQSWPLGSAYAGLNAALNPFGMINTLRFTVPNPLSPPLQLNPPVSVNAGNTGYSFSADYLLNAGCNNAANSGFCLGCMTCVDVQVDALIYAERGSWFVIPGQFWNNYSDSSALDQNILWPAPKYHEPYDVRIIVNGAIAENRPAPPDMEKQWLQHWRGADIWYYTTGVFGTGTPDLWDPANAGWDATNWRYTNDNRRMGIVYQYDATLARPVCYDLDPDNPGVRYYRPRLPRLPVGENTNIIWKTQGT